MKTRHSTLLLIAALAATANAATNFIAPAGFGASPADGAATWDTFAATADPDVFDATGVVVSGPNSPVSSSATASRIVPWAPFAGLLSPDSIYTHDGAISFEATATFGNDVNFVRVSYALVDGGNGDPSGFPNIPTISGATRVGSGSYPDGVRSVVFYTDFQLPAPAGTVATSFGDLPVANTSFRSIEGVRVAGFASAPAPVTIPEPGPLFLLLGATLSMASRRRR